MLTGSAHGTRRTWVFVPTLLFAACAVCAAPNASTTVVPDYAREDRWTQEIVPSVLTGDAVYLATPSRSKVLALYAEPERFIGSVKGGVIVVHGLGVHPDWGLIGAIRTGLIDAGVATLSVQMPVLASNAPAIDYPPLFGVANERLAAAVAFLRAHHIERIVIVSHSLGSAMTDAFLASSPAPRINGWVTIGMQGGFSALTSEPLLDVTAENDLPQVRSSIGRRESQLPHDRCSRHVVIAGADHFMEQRYADLLAVITPFVTRAVTGAC